MFIDPYMVIKRRFISQYSQCFYKRKMTTKARNMKSMRVFDLLTHFYRREVGLGILGPSYWIWLIVLQKLFDPYDPMNTGEFL